LFQIVFEGIVGRNSLGNIAIDDISIAPGVCPSKLLLNVICLFMDTPIALPFVFFRTF